MFTNPPSVEHLNEALVGAINRALEQRHVARGLRALDELVEPIATISPRRHGIAQAFEMRVRFRLRCR